MIFDTAASTLFDSVLQVAEDQLRASLRREHASPFIAHHPVTEPDTVRDAVKQFVRGDLKRVRSLFRDAPAVTVWALASALAATYAENDNIACYPILEDALGLAYALAQKEREELRDWFRLAALQLGLSLPPKDGGRVGDLDWQKIDDFFAQAGVAHNQAKRLAEIFRDGQRLFGPPEADSTDSLRRWESEVLGRCTPQGLRRLPKIVLSDTTGYHAGLLARLEAEGDADTAFAQLLRDALHEIPAQIPQLVPRLLLVDGQLVVSDIQRRAEFDVSFDGGARIRGVRSHALPIPWPSELRCFSTKGNTRLSVLAEDVLAMVFDASSGRLDHSIRTGDRTVAVRRGEVGIISRHRFSVDGIEAGETGPGAFMLYIEVDRTLALEVNGLRIALQPQARAALRPLGGIVVARDGNVPLIAGIHGIIVEYPGMQELVGLGGLELELRHPALPEGCCVVPCGGGDGGDQLVVSLAEVLPSHGDFDLLQIDLRQAGSDRRLARERFWFWPGLTGFPNGERFVAPAVPANFDGARSEFVRLGDSDHLELVPTSDVLYEEARLVMRRVDDEGGESDPLASFRLPPPGVSILLREVDGTSRPLRVGQTLALAPRDGSTLRIRTSDRSALLDVKGMETERCFRNGAFDLSAVRLVNEVPIDGAGNVVRYRGGQDGAHWQTLVQLVDVAEVLRFAVRETPSESHVNVTLGRLPYAVQVELESLTTGRVTAYDENHPALLMLRFDADQSFEVMIRKSRIPEADVFIARLRVAFEPGRWRELTNARRDRYDWAFDNRAPHLVPLNGAEQMLARLTQVLSRCVAPECWEGGMERHLVDRWRVALANLRRSTPPGYRAVLASAHAPYDTERSSTWVPLLHPLEGFPNLYGAPVSEFRGIPATIGTPEADHLRWLAELDSCRSFADAFSRLGIDPIFAIGFENCVALSAETETVPRNFDFDRYRMALHQVARDGEPTWTPSQPRLNAEHHARCCAEFERRVRHVVVPDRNQERFTVLVQVAAAAADPLRLASESVLTYGALDASVPGMDLDRSPHVRSVPLLLSALVRYSIADRERDLEALLSRTASVPASAVRQSLGFATRLAPELLAFYILLWRLSMFGDSRNA